MSLIVAVDTGGTFTDLVAYDNDNGRVTYTKSLTTYDDLVGGVMNAVGKAKIDLGRAALVKFGTTLVINTFIQRNGARTALVTTSGFRDVLELRRGNRPFAFDLHYHRDPALVDRELRFEIDERIAADGSILRPLEPTKLKQLAEVLRKMDVEAVAVSFINAYVDDYHEQQAIAILRECLPDVYITAGTELSREWYEYERTSTAAANAYVGPRLEDYVGRLDGRLRSEGFGRSFFMMASNGGVFSVARAKQQPVMLVESGPVGGCIGACAYARELSIGKLIAFDMGGTTAKCALVEAGQFSIRSPYYVGGTDYGFPIHGSVVDILEVGAGGGSIASIDAHGRLTVGPLSAGSDPGPVCYSRGGVKPTITDANLALGRINADTFLGGEMMLDASAARASIETKVAAPLGFSTDDAGICEAAAGILALGAVTMASAIKQITIERGMDPREFSLFAFGGGGPLHAATLARELSIPEVIIPPEPGNFSAVGMLVSDARIDESHTFLRAFDHAALGELQRTFADMERKMRSTLQAEVGMDVGFVRAVEMRYIGQKQGIRTEIGTAIDLDAIRATFNETYVRRFGHVDIEAPVEFVNLHLTGLAALQRPTLASIRAQVRHQDPLQGRTRSVYFAERGARVETPVLQRGALAPDFSMDGPAIIEEYGSTTVIGPDDHFRIGDLGEIRISFKKAAS